MGSYSKDELEAALRAVESIIHKCEKALEKFPEGEGHHMYLSKALILQELSKDG